MQLTENQNPDVRNQLVALYLSTFASGFSQQFVDPLELETYIDSMLNNGKALFATQNSTLLGALLYCPLSFVQNLPDDIVRHFPIEKCVYVAELMVDETVRGKGIGTQLLTTFFDTIKTTTDYSDIFIRVWDENKQALALYTRLGFSVVATAPQQKLRADKSATFIMQKMYLHKKI